MNRSEVEQIIECEEKRHTEIMARLNSMLRSFPPPTYISGRVRVKFNVDIEALRANGKAFSRMEDRGFNYYTDSILGEFCSINKETREIIQKGFDGMLMSWDDEGLIENY